MNPRLAALLAASLGAFGFPGNLPGGGSRSSSRVGTGPGWTNAHAKRVARKARNVKRHRATSKGKA
jgi:hypothetical protein